VADQSTATCSGCGYSLRGITSDHCPECGKAVQRKLVFLDREQFEAAERALRAAGITFQSLDSDRGLGKIFGSDLGMMDRRHILIDHARFDDVLEVFENHGIHFPVPLVDRRDPFCPQCAQKLEPSAEPPCPMCDHEFMWVEIDEPLVTYIARACHKCGYNLRGIESDQCPECGAFMQANLDALVAAASGHAVNDDPIPFTVSFQPETIKWMVRVFAFLGILGVCILLWSLGLTPVNWSSWGSIAWLVMFVTATAAVLAFVDRLTS